MQNFQEYESLVFIGTEWSNLRYRNIVPDSIKIIAEDFDGKNHNEYTCYADYEVDYEAGRVRRTESSTIGDYRNSKFYDKDVFTHEGFGGQWGNYPFMVYVSYQYESDGNVLTCDNAYNITLSSGTKTLRDSRVVKRLLAGEEITYLVYGDSISTGCEAIYPSQAYFNLFANKLQSITGGKINLVNKSIGGEKTDKGLARFDDVLFEAKPDLVSISYGVNDMCVKNGKSEVSIEEFESNIRSMVKKVQDIGAEIVLITNCIPNPNWVFTSPSADNYPQILRKLSAELSLPLADVWALWQSELKNGKTLHDLLLNDVNHPTTYGHSLYAQMLYTLL